MVRFEAIRLLKKKEPRYKEKCIHKRRRYLQQLEKLILIYGEEHLVFWDESGFVDEYNRDRAWSKKGVKVYGEVQGKRQSRTNLLMAQRGKEWLAPILFNGSCNSKIVEMWLEEYLLKSLDKPSIIIMDNARFHRKKEIIRIMEKEGHVVLFLPPYSPDYNPIEQTFGAIKKILRYGDDYVTLDSILQNKWFCYL